ncbi:MAG: hypothetical protein P8J87_06770 [Verrucomicrobiales bacterium]|nr:hypothetical protein [Verrucomicrobiales bacterium]
MIACIGVVAEVRGQADSSPFGFFFDGSGDEVDFSDSGGDTVIPDLGLAPATTGGGKGSAKYKGYVEPNFSKVLFDVEKLGLEAAGKKAIARLLTAAAVNFPKDKAVTGQVKAKALALAKRLDKSSAAIFTANSMLKRGLTPRKVAGDDVTSKRKVADGIWKVAVKQIDGSSDGDRKLGAYLVDLSADLDPDDPFKLERRGRLVQAGVGASWVGILDGVSGGRGGQPARPVVEGSRLARKSAAVAMIHLKVLKDGTTGGGAGKVAISATENSGGGKMTMAVAGGTPKLRESAPIAVGRLAAAYGNWPDGVKVTARLGSWYRTYETNSAAVACAVGVDSVMRDWDVDPQVALIGGVDAVGKITAVRELASRLKSAKEAGISIVGVPSDDDGEVADLCVLDKLQPFLDVQVFAMETIDDGVALAPVKRNPDLQKAIDAFVKIQTALAGKDIAAMVRNSAVQARLREIGQLAPNHISAKYLLLAGMNRRPTSLSFQGSRDALTEVAVPIGRAAGYGVTAETVLLKAPADIAADCVFSLQTLRPKLHKATLNYCDSLTKYAAAFKIYASMSNPISARAQTMRKQMNEAMRALKLSAEKFRKIDNARFAN